MQHKIAERMIPPQNLEAEQSVLGAVLSGKAGVEIIPRPEFFYRDAHKIIASAILSLTANESVQKVDLISVTNWLNDNNKLDQIGGPVYLASLFDEAPIFFNPKHKEIIEKKALLRRIIQVSGEVVAKAYQEQSDFDGILAGWQRGLNEVMSELTSGSTESMDVGFDELMGHFSARETHLRCLDDAIGGLFGGDVIILGGRTSMGKTSLVLGLLSKIAIENKQPSIYFGPEVTKEKIYGRLLSSNCRIGFRSLRRGKVEKNQREMLRNFHKKINESPIHILATSGKINAVDIVMQTKSLAEKLKEEMGLVIIENLQQLTWPEKTKDRKEEIDLIYGCLKSLAMELNVPIVISSQIKREVEDREDKRPLPSDLSGSGDIESLADTILILYRDEYYYPERTDKANEGSVDAEITVYKTGPPTVLHLGFNSDFLLWEDK